jgi:alpha-galactosidase
LAALAGWVNRFKRFRPLLHTGRVVRIDVPDDAVFGHGVIARDQREALIAHVQLDESVHNRGVHLRVPGLNPALCYQVRWEGPVDDGMVSEAPPAQPAGPTGGRPVSGAVLACRGVWIPRRRPESILLIHVEAV